MSIVEVVKPPITPKEEKKTLKKKGRKRGRGKEGKRRRFIIDADVTAILAN